LPDWASSPFNKVKPSFFGPISPTIFYFPLDLLILRALVIFCFRQAFVDQFRMDGIGLKGLADNKLKNCW
jgi:hypothetical protein